MILVIRISGMVEVDEKVEEALFRMRLRRKYSAILMKESEEGMKLLKKVRDFVAFGKIDEKTLMELIAKRGELKGGKKVGAVKASEIVKSLDKKSLQNFGVKPFFRLHPPIGGIDSKIHFGRKKGVLGDNKEKINDLVRRML